MNKMISNEYLKALGNAERKFLAECYACDLFFCKCLKHLEIKYKVLQLEYSLCESVFYSFTDN